MSAKVQAALLHSQAVFARQAGLVEQAVLARAFWVRAPARLSAAAWPSTYISRQG